MYLNLLFYFLFCNNLEAQVTVPDRNVNKKAEFDRGVGLRQRTNALVWPVQKPVARRFLHKASEVGSCLVHITSCKRSFKANL